MSFVLQQWQKLKSILGLSYSLAKANFKLRNEGSYFGILWYLLNPLALFCIILFIQGSAFSNVKILYYPIYLLVGITGTNFFAQTLSSAIKAIDSNASFIKSMKIPYESFVVAQVLQSIFSHLFEFILIGCFMIYFHVSLFGLLLYPIAFFFFVLTILGISFIFATIGVYIADFGNVWSALSQIIFFITPTFYAIKPGDHMYLTNLFNPLFYFLTIARDFVTYSKFPPAWMMLVMIAMSLASFIIGLSIFVRFKKTFPEKV
jgi:ABC-type polysaccharide/polyol phosphate export permease